MFEIGFENKIEKNGKRKNSLSSSPLCAGLFRSLAYFPRLGFGPLVCVGPSPPSAPAQRRGPAARAMRSLTSSLLSIRLQAQFAEARPAAAAPARPSLFGSLTARFPHALCHRRLGSARQHRLPQLVSNTDTPSPKESVLVPPRAVVLRRKPPPPHINRMPAPVPPQSKLQGRI